MAEGARVRIPALHTQRLVLEPPSRRCEALYERFYTDAEASRSYGGPLTPRAAWMRLAADVGTWQLRGFGVWAVRRLREDDLVGTAGFWQARGWPCELTWWLLPEARGQGLALEASRAVLAHAGAAYGWTSVETYMPDANAAARGLALRLGATRVDRRVFPDGVERDVFRIPVPAPSGDGAPAAGR